MSPLLKLNDNYIALTELPGAHVTASTQHTGRDKRHTCGESEKTAYFALVLAQQSPPKAELRALALASFYAWLASGFLETFYWLHKWARLQGFKEIRGRSTYLLCYTGSQLMQEASKITEAKSMQGEYPVLDIWLALFICYY